MNTNRVIVSGTSVETVVAENINRTFLTIENIGTTTMFIGGSGNITDATGFPLFAGDTFTDGIYIGSYFAVCSDGVNATLNFMEED